MAVARPMQLPAPLTRAVLVAMTSIAWHSALGCVFTSTQPGAAVPHILDRTRADDRAHRVRLARGESVSVIAGVGRFNADEALPLVVADVLELAGLHLPGVPDDGGGGVFLRHDDLALHR